MAMPFNSTTSSNQTWSEWAQGQTDTIVEPLYEVRDQVVQGWEWLQEFLPGKVTNYVEKTAGDGAELLDDIYQETRDSIVEKTSDNVDDITGLMEGFIQKLTDIKDNTVNIGEYKHIHIGVIVLVFVCFTPTKNYLKWEEVIFT